MSYSGPWVVSYTRCAAWRGPLRAAAFCLWWWRSWRVLSRPSPRATPKSLVLFWRGKFQPPHIGSYLSCLPCGSMKSRLNAAWLQHSVYSLERGWRAPLTIRLSIRFPVISDFEGGVIVGARYGSYNNLKTAVLWDFHTVLCAEFIENDAVNKKHPVSRKHHANEGGQRRTANLIKANRKTVKVWK